MALPMELTETEKAALAVARAAAYRQNWVSPGTTLILVKLIDRIREEGNS